MPGRGAGGPRGPRLALSRPGQLGDGELCKDRRRKEGSERAGRSGRKVERLAERGRRTEQGAARAGSSRYVRGKGAQSPVGRPPRVEWTWNPERSGNGRRRLKWVLGGADRNGRLVPGDIYFKSWGGGRKLPGDIIWRVVAE